MSVLKLRFLDSDDSPFLRYEGRASWNTFLRVVINRHGADWVRAETGRWVPSQMAQELGEWAVLLEMLTHRDRLTLSVAVQVVVRRSDADLTDRDVYRLYDQLPARTRREFVDVDVVGGKASGLRPDEELVAREREDELRRSWAVTWELVDQLEPEDALIFRMRHDDGFTLKRIGEAIGLPTQRVHDRLKRIYKRLAKELRERGVDGKELLAS